MTPASITTHSEPSMVYPFIAKDGTALTFKSISESEYQSFEYGSSIGGKYPLSAGITIKSIQEYVTVNDSNDPFADLDSDGFKIIMQERPEIIALKNTLNYYKVLSPHFEMNPPTHLTGAVNKLTEPLTLISIPSIFYGSSIEKGTVNLKYYLNGELKGELQDDKKNGELIQVFPELQTDDPDYRKVVGVVLYNEGFIILFGGDDHWLNDWGINPAADHTSTLSFNGINHIPTLTMLAHAKKGELNHSNNPTYLTYASGRDNILTDHMGGTVYAEPENLEIVNTTKSPHKDAEASFQKQTWISKIGIYDENKNLIAIAKLANPIRKTEDRDFTFKLKLDF